MTISIGAGPTNVTDTGQTSKIVTLVGTTAGRSIIVGILTQNNTATVSSVTCSGESALTVCTSSTSINRTAQWAYLDNITTGGDKTITVNWTGSVTNLRQSIVAIEIAGGDTSDIFDKIANANGSSTAATVSITTAADNEALFGIVWDSTVQPTTNTGFTGITLATPAEFVAGQYKLDAGSAGAKTFDFATMTSSFWVLSVIALNKGTNTGISPTAGSAGITGSAPTVARTDNSFITPAAGALVLTGQLAGVNSVYITPTAGSLGLTGFAPSVVYGGHLRAPTAATLGITGASPLIFGGTTITPTAGSLALTGTTSLRAENSAISFEAMTAFGFGVIGTIGVGSVTLESMTVDASGPYTAVGSGGSVFERMTAVGYGPGVTNIAFEAMTVVGNIQEFGSGSVSFPSMATVNYAGFVTFEL